MTTANKITILRILLVPFFVVEILYYVQSGNELHRLLGVLAFAVAAILDGVDGYVARHYNQRSELGTLLDPIADKLLLVSAIVVLSFDHHPRLGQIPLWLTGTIIGRDLLLGLGAVTVRLVVGAITVHPRITGKIATVFQMATVLWILLRWDALFTGPYLKMWILGAGLFTGVSGLLYVWDGTQQLSSHPSSSPVTGPAAAGSTPAPGSRFNPGPSEKPSA
jgi:CDP-diacylglycerol--glycerol-3-phosphate 3-phosphatidyltransferase